METQHREQTYGDGAGEKGKEGESGIYAERNMETCITICKINSRWEFFIWLRELKLGLCNNLEGWEGKEDGRETQEGGNICISTAYSRWCLAETNTIL